MSSAKYIAHGVTLRRKKSARTPRTLPSFILASEQAYILRPLEGAFLFAEQIIPKLARE